MDCSSPSSLLRPKDLARYSSTLSLEFLARCLPVPVLPERHPLLPPSDDEGAADRSWPEPRLAPASIDGDVSGDLPPQDDFDPLDAVPLPYHTHRRPPCARGSTCGPGRTRRRWSLMELWSRSRPRLRCCPWRRGSAHGGLSFWASRGSTTTAVRCGRSSRAARCSHREGPAPPQPPFVALVLLVRSSGCVHPGGVNEKWPGSSSSRGLMLSFSC